MTSLRVLALTALAMLAFASNSLLCRVALEGASIDAASFTALRIVSGCAALWLIVALRGRSPIAAGRWRSALALFAYAAAFSFAYRSLSAATGALLLFGAVQGTMIGSGLWRGERLGASQAFGISVAGAGLVALLLPGLSAPPTLPACLMLSAGVAWGIYSLLGRTPQGAAALDPTFVTAGNFLRATPMAVALALALLPDAPPSPAGVGLAVASGALASGAGYAVWYAALPSLRAASAASVQLSVPLIAAAGGVLLLGEPLTARLVLASAAILGGIALSLVAAAQR